MPRLGPKGLASAANASANAIETAATTAHALVDFMSSSPFKFLALTSRVALRAEKVTKNFFAYFLTLAINEIPFFCNHFYYTYDYLENIIEMTI
jgi:hypothetical protein